MVRHDLLQLNYFRIHLLYFLIGIIIGSVIIFVLPNDGVNISYIDSLSLAASSMTATGLNVINLGDLSTGQQITLFILMLIGNQMFTTIPVVWIRKYFFKKHFEAIVRDSKSHHISLQQAEAEMGSKHNENESNGQSHAQKSEPNHEMESAHAHAMKDEEKKQDTSSNGLAATRRKHSASHLRGLGAFPTPWETQTFSKITSLINSKDRKRYRHDKYLSFEPKVTGNSSFHSLTTKQEEELGGVEYRALELLTWLLPVYIVFWILLGIIILAPWATYTYISSVIRTSQPGNLNPSWFSSFLVVSALTNCGLDLLNSSFSLIYGEYLVILVSIVLLMAGNTLYPAFLRFAIWLLHIMSSGNSSTRATTQYLLDHPRRTFIYLFPAYETWNLLLITFLLQGFSWGMYVTLNAHNATTEAPYTEGQYILAGFFQAIAIRHGGFYITTLSDLAPGMLVIYLIYMYISNYPVVMAIRHSNVYEDHSLGISADDAEDIGLMRHIQEQLFYDAWWVALAYFLIAVIEARHFVTLEAGGFTLFTVLFEIVSAYGNVGASLSLTGEDYSLSGNFHILSKLVLIAVMIRGRHRGLPSAVDRSIMLPGEKHTLELDRRQKREES